VGLAKIIWSPGREFSHKGINIGVLRQFIETAEAVDELLKYLVLVVRGQ
jgi:hypothetical protein